MLIIAFDFMAIVSIKLLFLLFRCIVNLFEARFYDIVFCKAVCFFHPLLEYARNFSGIN